MRIGFGIDYRGNPHEVADQVGELEAAGLDVVWAAEAYGFDSVSILGYVAARTERVSIGTSILNVYSRTPGALAQTAAGLDAVSQGRFELGLGASGPQVIEGWHGLPYTRPITRTREVVELVRRMLAREVIEFEGETVTLPLPPEEGTGLGKPLKMLTHPVRDRVPIHVASLGPRNVEMTAEVADGWMPIFFWPERVGDVWGESLAAGTERRDPSLGPLDTIVSVAVGLAEGEQRTAMLDTLRPTYALYVGGMGSRDRNFYNDLATRYGFADEAATIQDLYLDGRKDAAAAAVPERLLEQTNLVGSEGFIRERLEAHREAGVTTINIQPLGDPVRLTETLRAWV
jgi:F420-dependent oxidoreductase-like protein